MSFDYAKRVLSEEKTPYQWLQEEKFCCWSIMSGIAKNSNGRWTAWAKKGKFKARSPLAESGEVFFDFGSSRQEAIDRLIKNDIRNCG